MSWNAIKAQFFFTYAIIGSVLPFIALWLKECGLDKAQMGYILATSGLAAFITPVVVSFLADTRFEPRRLLGWVYFFTGATLVLLWFADGFWPIFGLFVLHALAAAPVSPLQDGVFFGAEREANRRVADGFPGAKPPPVYHQVRVWGTVGFILPSLILFFVMSPWLAEWVEHLQRTGWIQWRGQFAVGARVVLLCGAAFSFVGFANTFALPAVRRGEDKKPGPPGEQTPDVTAKPEAAGEAEEATGVGVRGASVPTIEAARAMLSPGVMVFCIAMFLVHISGAVYYNLFALLLTEINHLDAKWVGLVANLGVLVEVFFVLGLGRMETRVGLRGIVVWGSLCIAARMACLCLSSYMGLHAPEGDAGQATRMAPLWIAIASQGFHGMMVIVMHLAAPLLLNRVAKDSYRTSMQGLYSMSIVGGGKITGSLVGGFIGAMNMIGLFGLASALCIVATGLFTRSLRIAGQNTPGRA